MYKAVVFDMDDTLVHTRKIKYLAHKHTAKQFYNLTLTDADLDRHWGKAFDQLMLELYGPVDPLEKIIANYYSISQNYPLAPRPHARKVVRHFADHFLTGLLTATNTPLMISALAEAGLDQKLFSYIQTSDNTTFHKPNPKVFDPAIKFFAEHSVKPAEIVYVGDVLNDFYAARDAGLHFIGIATNTIPQSAFREAGAEAVDSLLDLLTLIS